MCSKPLAVLACGLCLSSTSNASSSSVSKRKSASNIFEKYQCVRLLNETFACPSNHWGGTLDTWTTAQPSSCWWNSWNFSRFVFFLLGTTFWSSNFVEQNNAQGGSFSMPCEMNLSATVQSLEEGNARVHASWLEDCLFTFFPMFCMSAFLDFTTCTPKAKLKPPLWTHYRVIQRSSGGR